ncbi:hypothetical protein OG914_22460 [Streptomyces sp. NBC_00291]|uniref:hypothetical protein n=1 Tax=Streptomyces sp. NBC_00291 TaxID=2975704 RepID=UPI002252CEE8|nr:hypothetical protein [Streptomyces sp. NBC_00291]MCX5156747.1 hypothetical protein [Streptomyces sp. NBC_00291]
MSGGLGVTSAAFWLSLPGLSPAGHDALRLGPPEPATWSRPLWVPAGPSAPDPAPALTALDPEETP